MIVRCGIPPLRLEEYIDADRYHAGLMETYFGEGRQLDSRTTPQDKPIPALGSWRISSLCGLDGREIDELAEVPLDFLAIREDTGPQKRADVLRYAVWWAEGSEPPPIAAVQCEKGYFVASDHRRLLAARLIGRPTMKVWVNWLTSSPRNTLTGLTFENRSGTRFQAIPAPEDRRIFQDDARMLERLRKEFSDLRFPHEESRRDLCPKA